MALTIEIDHAKTRARKAAAAGATTKGVPQSVKGRIRRLKWVILVLTLGVYYLAPFLRWDRGPGDRTKPSCSILNMAGSTDSSSRSGRRNSNTSPD